VIAVSDPQVATALQFIRAHAGEPINVKDLLNICSLTRRMLDLRFQQALGRTISREIKRVRIERAKDLLRRSPLSIRAVARAAGFHSPRLFARLFHQITGILPTQYRAQTQSQSTG
jgi:LacI family transcriptional regulator